MLDTLNVATLVALMPGLTPQRAQAYHAPLVSAMREFEINTPERAAAFLAQLGHESGGLRYMEEIADGSAYEGRKDLGNLQIGDGKRFKGRGPIQLTGRRNYALAGKALGLDLEGNPAQAADPQVGFRIAGWFWTRHNLNYLADTSAPIDFDQITRKINGGFNGKDDRDRRWHLARQVLKLAPVA